MKAASVYASRLGWAVVPLHSAIGGVCSCSKGSSCPSAGKHPRIADWPQHATSNADTVAQWAAQWPQGNVGVATGAASGFFVLDVDGDRGRESLEALGPLPLTATARTGSGGSHYLFSLPDFPVANSASKVAPGLDIRGDGGQIVVAPSRSSRGAYAWIHPPWETAPAPAPTWLLEALQRAPQAAPAPAGPAPVFPAAGPDTLEAARTALDAHGPAVEGRGGDAHTFVAAALLRHDFALTEAEAWPLLVEWNATCQPPWGEADLAAKLRGGDKYATKPYGCRRAVDTVEAARALISEWQASGGAEGAMFALLDRVRDLAAICGDRARHGVIERDLVAATGLKPKQLALPPPSLPHEEAPAGTIEITPRIHEMADKATAQILPHVYARNGVLCEVVKAERVFIADLEVPRVLDLASRHAKWIRYSEKGATQQPPPPVVGTILAARRIHQGVRVLEGVTNAPIFLADGSILQTRGYSPLARVFLDPSVEVDVPEDPGLAEARAAIDVFRDLLGDVRFAETAGFSAWLAGLLTPLVKSAIGNAPAPLVCVSAPSAGAGKTLLTEIAARIITGTGAEVRPYNPKDPSEWGKRVTAYVRAGSPISVFDNVNGPFGDETTDRLITSSTWSDRVLGASDAPPIAVTSSWWATGNNIEPMGDTLRRILMVRMQVDEDRPQERAGFKRPDLLGYVGEHRGDLLTAALTILRAFHVAGRPDQGLAPWGSFAAWSMLVRGALVWAGCVDPFETQRQASADLNEADTEAHDFWIDAVGATDGTPAAIITVANQRDAQGVLGIRDQITPHGLRRFLHRFVDRPRAGHRIRKAHGRYIVESVTGGPVTGGPVTSPSSAARSPAGAVG